MMTSDFLDVGRGRCPGFRGVLHTGTAQCVVICDGQTATAWIIGGMKPGGPASPTKRSAVVLDSRHSLILSAPVVSNFLATLPMLIHPGITVEPWPLCQETGIVLPGDLVIHGSGRWSLTLHRSTLVWQPPIDEPRTIIHSFCECCSRCGYQPYNCIIIRFVE